MSLHITSTTYDDSADAVVVRLAGAGDRRVLLSVTDGIEAVAEDVQRVVVDLEHLILTSAEAVRAFVAALSAGIGADRVVYSCSRRSARVVLRRWGGNGITIVPSVPEALSLPTAAVAT